MQKTANKFLLQKREAESKENDEKRVHNSLFYIDLNLF